MKVLRSILFYLVVVFSFPVGSALTCLASLAVKPASKAFRFVASRWSRLLVLISGVKITVSGKENVPRGEAVIFVSNHQGAADIPILLASIPVLFRFIIKKELFKIPFFGWYLRKADYLCVDRGAADKAHSFMSEAVNLLKAGQDLLIFPEGTRSRDGKLGEFKRGSLLLAFKAKVKIVPVAVSGSFDVFKGGSLLVNAVPVRVSIGKPISLEKYGSKFDKALEDVRSAIERML
ncbi:MAG: lysophospholipid acyltransferase family protein [Candidatus Margulisiibacteriota bacterium]